MLLQSGTRVTVRGVIPRVRLSTALVGGSLLLAALSLLLPSAPTYDPFAWIIWGREIIHLDLDTVNGPSWKPLPVMVTTLTAPFGEASPYVWLIVARAGAIAAIPLAFVLARRLAGIVAGVGAAASLALMPWWVRNAALGNSEGLMVALVLGAVLTHLAGRRGWAFALAVAAGLLRPEAWPFLGLYALWLLYEDRTRLRWVAGGLASLPVLWLAPEMWGSGNPFRASERAQDPNPNSPAFADHPVLEVVKDAIGLAPAAAVAGAALALVLALAVRGRPREARVAVVVLAALTAAWIGLVAVMTSGGFSGNARYLIVPAALLIVLGAIGVVWVLELVQRRPRTLPVAVAAALAVGLSALFAAPDAHLLGANLTAVRYQADLYHDLVGLIDDAGGKERLKACGRPFTGPFLVPEVAWQLGTHTNDVQLVPTSPAVVFHVKTVSRAGWAPPLEPGRQVLARRGGWILTADCGAAR